MNRAKQTILRLLREKSPASGLDLVQRSNGAVRRGTVYVHLSSLERDGFVRSFREDKPRTTQDGQVIEIRGRALYRWLYELTGPGRKKLMEIEEEDSPGWGTLPDGSPA